MSYNYYANDNSFNFSMINGSNIASATASQFLQGPRSYVDPAFSIISHETSLREINNQASAYNGETFSLSSVSINESDAYLSQTEQVILRSKKPIEIKTNEEITIIGQTGIWINKPEIENWQGDLSIDKYPINEDANPRVIKKKLQQTFQYVQELAIRYLKPPTPPVPGEILITQEVDFSVGPAPPLIIRQQPQRANTPEPLIIRETPPEMPKPLGKKRITISGKRSSPPPRKVIIERLAQIPRKPQNVIIERWLPYTEPKRRVIFTKASDTKTEVIRPRNTIIEWESPTVHIRKEVKYLGVKKANPAEYIQKYGASLMRHNELPEFVMEIQTPSQIGHLAAEIDNKTIELEGDLEELKHVNLDTEGLTEYREQLAKKGIKDLGCIEEVRSSARSTPDNHSSVKLNADLASSSASASLSVGVSAVSTVASQIFTRIDKDSSGYVTLEEAEKIVLRLNSQLNRPYGEEECKAFFTDVCGLNDKLTREQFVQAFENLANNN